MVFLVYNNFIKKEKFEYVSPKTSESESTSVKFDFELFEDEVFKNLVQAKQITLPTPDQLGRENPFLSF